MKTKIKKIVNILLPLLLGVFFVYYAYIQFTPEQLTEMKSYFSHVNYQYIVLATFFSVIGLVSRAYRWKYALNYLGYQSSFNNNMMAVCVGYLMNLTIPRSGELSRAVVLQKYEKIPFDKGFGTIIAERVIDLIFLLVFVLIAVSLQYHQLKDFLSEKIPLQNLVLSGFVLLVLMMAGIYLVFYSDWSFFKFIRQKIQGLIEGVLSIFKMPHRLPFLLHTVIIWISYILTFYYGTFILQETVGISFGVVMVTFVVGSVAMTFTSGGFGAFPLMISQIMVLYGISVTVGTSFGWILWILQTVFTIITGAISFLLLPVLNKNK